MLNILEHAHCHYIKHTTKLTVEHTKTTRWFSLKETQLDPTKWRSRRSPFKGSRKLTIPKKVTIAELPGTFQFFRYVKRTKLKHHKKKNTSPFQLHLQQGSLDYIILLLLILVEIKKCSKKKTCIYIGPGKKLRIYFPPTKKTAISFGVVTVLYLPSSPRPKRTTKPRWRFLRFWPPRCGWRLWTSVPSEEEKSLGWDGRTNFSWEKMAPYRSWSWKWDS